MDCPIVRDKENGGYEYKKPSEIISPLSWEYIKAFGFYEKSILPNGNGWINESNRFVEAMQIIDNEMGQIKKEESKKKNGWFFTIKYSY